MFLLLLLLCCWMVQPTFYHHKLEFAAFSTFYRSLLSRFVFLCSLVMTAFEGVAGLPSLFIFSNWATSMDVCVIIEKTWEVSVLSSDGTVDNILIFLVLSVWRGQIPVHVTRSEVTDTDTPSWIVLDVAFRKWHIDSFKEVRLGLT